MTTATKGIVDHSVSENETHRFRITVSKFERFEAGAQVFIKYGKYSNRQLLLHYGFAMLENVYNYARIKVKLGHFLNTQQNAALGKGYSPDLFTIFKLKISEFGLDLLKSFRSFSWNIDSHSTESFFYPSNLPLEHEALEKMANLLNEILNSFPTSIEEDQDLLGRVSNSRNYFAVIYRIGVKKVIRKQIELTLVAIEIVERLIKTNDFSTVSEKCFNENEENINENRKKLSNYIELLKQYTKNN